jgi:hypothetical protein
MLLIHLHLAGDSKLAGNLLRLDGLDYDADAMLAIRANGDDIIGLGSAVAAFVSGLGRSGGAVVLWRRGRFSGTAGERDTQKKERERVARQH